MGKSRIDGHKLKEMANQAGFPDKQQLDKVVVDLTGGARTGCRGKFRDKSDCSNAPSAFQYGEQVSDAIAEWVKEGFAHGPTDESDLPINAKISGIMTKLKPNGSVRVILNLTAPGGIFVNEGIDVNEFPAVMSSTKKWIRVLRKAGAGCKMVKIDWAAAYKQIAVHQDDVNLQWFRWLGKVFCELSLVFGAVSSVGIFDRAAKVVLYIVMFRSGMPKELIFQHLDDCCGAAPAGNDMIYKFDNEYKSVANELGISLAPRDDPDKSFGPTTRGVVYGVYYDTVDQTWWLGEDKIS